MTEAASGALMIDVGDRDATRRRAVAEAIVTLPPAVADRVRRGDVEKGDVLRVAEVAGLLGLKRTADLLPMCHPIGVTGSNVTARLEGDVLRITAEAKTFDRTGVEMEVLTAVSIAALTAYDMLKRYDAGLVIGPVRLVEKSGGTHGEWKAAT